MLKGVMDSSGWLIKSGRETDSYGRIPSGNNFYFYFLIKGNQPWQLHGSYLKKKNGWRRRGSLLSAPLKLINEPFTIDKERVEGDSYVIKIRKH